VFLIANLQYTLNRDDYLQAQNLFATKSGFLTRVTVYGLPCFGVLLIAAVLVDLFNHPRSWGPSVFGVFWGLFLIFFRKISLARSFSKEKRLQQPMDLQVNDQGVELSNANGKTISHWVAFDRFVESEDLFVLFCGQRTFHAIPKRAFSESQIDEFRDLLRSKIPSK
jgi:hypothetical protein